MWLREVRLYVLSDFAFSICVTYLSGIWQRFLSCPDYAVRKIRIYARDLVCGSVDVVGPQVHHARNVLRLKAGEQVELFDGQGHYTTAALAQISRDRLTFSVASVATDAAGAGVARTVVLASAIPKSQSSAQECLVSHGTELGINEFWPLIFERSSVRRVSLDKWQRWSIEACKQCGRNRLPKIVEPMALDHTLQRLGRFDLKIYGSAEGACLPDRTRMPPDWKQAIIFVGPEGGFTDDELRLLNSHDVMPFRVGDHILRIETAGLAITAAVISN